MFYIVNVTPSCFKIRTGTSFLARPVVDVPTLRPSSGLSGTLSDLKVVAPAAMLQGHRRAPTAMPKGHRSLSQPRTRPLQLHDGHEHHFYS